MIEFLTDAPGLNEWTFIGFTVLAFFTAAFGTVAGLGGGVLMLGVMAILLPPAVIIPLHGVVQMGTNISRSILMRRDVLWGLFPAFAVGAVVGAAIGGQVVVALPTAMLQVILGLFLLYVCWAPKPRPERVYSVPKFFILGAVGALVSMFVGATGTLLAPFVQAACGDRQKYVATHAVLMTMVHGLKAVVFGLLGFAFAAYLPLMTAMIIAAFGGNYFGRSMLRRMSEKLFQRVFQVVLTLLSLRLLYSGISARDWL